MSRGIYRYECKCGGVITDSWDNVSDGSTTCNKCNNPYPANESELRKKPKKTIPSSEF